jgi:hypothetical protein
MPCRWESLQCRSARSAGCTPVPSRAYLPWLKAAVITPTTEPDDILKTYHMLNDLSKDEKTEKLRDIVSPPLKPNQILDIHRAELLRDLELRS